MSSNAKRPSFLDRSPTSAGSSPSAPTAKRARTELTSVEARLPSELFVRILAYCSRSTLGQIALTGHHLLDLARSQLWYKLRLDNEAWEEIEDYYDLIKEHTKVIRILNLPPAVGTSREARVWRDLLEPFHQHPLHFDRIEWITSDIDVGDTYFHVWFRTEVARLTMGRRSYHDSARKVFTFLDLVHETQHHYHHDPSSTHTLIFLDVVPPIDLADLPVRCPNLSLSPALKTIELRLKEGVSLEVWNERWNVLWDVMEEFHWPVWQSDWRQRWEDAVQVKVTAPASAGDWQPPPPPSSSATRSASGASRGRPHRYVWDSTPRRF